MAKSTEKVTWISIVGTRPQFIKLSPVDRMIKNLNRSGHLPYIEHRIVNTGQHYDHEMADLIINQLGLPAPNYNLGVGSGGQGEQLSRMLERLEPILCQERPDWTIVYGDTNSTLAGALIAARLQLPLAHVEAGCRSYNIIMAEEQNRLMVDHLSHLLLAPSRRAVANLGREGIGVPDDPRKRKAAFVGDVMHDALLQSRSAVERLAPAILAAYGLEPKRYYVLTLHRAENTINAPKVNEILHILEDVDLPVLFPVHPRTRKLLSESPLPSPNGKILMAPPLGYLEMHAVSQNACKIITDSGGVQKEAMYMRVPCVTLRRETEWPETVEAGANCLTDMRRDDMLEAISRSVQDVAPAAPFGDGNASQLIVNELLRAAL